jgi:catecholate siderophore receptor
MASRTFALLASASPYAIALAVSGLSNQASAQSGYGAPMQLPPISVEGAGPGAGDYKVDQPALPKLTQPLVDTPQTIDTMSRQLMDDQGATTMRDVLRNVPGISIAAGEFGAQGDSLTIRGFTARNDIYLDGMRDYGSYYRDPFYLEDIQVLKGPSSILFGRGSTGGIVEQDSKLPLLQSFTNGTLSFGTDLTKRVTLDVDRAVPDLAQGAAFRLNLMAQDGGVAQRDITQNSRFGIAPTLALGLGTPTRLTFTFLHQTEYDIPDYGVPWLYQGTAGSGTGLARPVPLSLTQSNFYGFERGDFLRTNVDVPTVKIEHDVNNALTLRDQLRYAHYVRSFRITEPQIYTAASAATPGGTGSALLIAPGTPLTSINVARNQLYGSSVETFLQNQADATAKFRTGFISHVLVGGIELGRETSDPVRNSTIGPYSTTPLLAPTPDQTFNANTYSSSRTSTTAETQAVYALDTMTLDEQWQVMGGLRFDRFDAAFQQTTFANPVTGAGAGSTSLGHIDRMLSWRAALIYKPLPIGSIYFSAGTSFNPSAESLSLSSSTANLDPVENRTYEVGTKWELFEKMLAVSAAVFQTEQTNVRETDPNNPLFQILVGNAVAKGFELETAGHITEHWQVKAGYAYTYSAITSSPQNDLGHRLGNVPMHTATLWTTYDFPWKLQVGGGAEYVSSRFASTTPTTAGGVAFWKEASGYWTLNAMAKYPLTDNVALQVNIYNLTDARFYDQLHPAHVVPGAGRSALFTVSFNY